MRLAINYTYEEYERKDYRHFATSKKELMKKRKKEKGKKKNENTVFLVVFCKSVSV